MKTLTEQYIIKSRSGVYQDTSENRRKHRVGQHYGEAKKGGEEGKLSKREQREVRLASYKDGLKKLEDRLKEGGLSDITREKIESLRDTLKGKIAKLEAKLARGGKKALEKPKEASSAEEETVEEAGKRVFDGLSDADKKKVLDFYKEQSEDLLKDERMTPSLVIGEVEEYRDSELDFSDDVEDFKEEFGLKSTSEAYGLARHALNLEIKRLEALEKEAEKKEGLGSSEKGLVHVVGESSPRFASKKGLVFADISDNAKKDFNKFSGINTEEAVAFMNKVIDKTGFNGRAKLFYSGYAGWTLFDENEEKIGNLMYDGNKYGLEDATWGDGWVWKGWGSDWSRKLSKVIPELNVRPPKPRM